MKFNGFKLAKLRIKWRYPQLAEDLRCVCVFVFGRFESQFTWGHRASTISNYYEREWICRFPRLSFLIVIAVFILASVL
jgi:hypothetical protein